jgi:hypothetical protein
VAPQTLLGDIGAVNSHALFTSRYTLQGSGRHFAINAAILSKVQLKMEIGIKKVKKSDYLEIISIEAILKLNKR